MLDSLPKHSAYAQCTPEYYGGYDQITLRNNHTILQKKERNMKKQNHFLHCKWINHHKDLPIRQIVYVTYFNLQKTKKKLYLIIIKASSQYCGKQIQSCVPDFL